MSWTSRLRTPDRLINTSEAQAGHCLAQFPTELQSWQRYAELSGMCWSIGVGIRSPDLFKVRESIWSHLSTVASSEIPQPSAQPH